MLQLWNPDRWRVGKELTALQREMDRLFDDFTAQLPQLTRRGDVDFVPACNVEETDSNYLVSVDVPGMKKEDLKIELSSNVLTISGEHKEERKEGKKSQRITERYEGCFERSFHLPDIADSAKIEANYADGVLNIGIPKMAKGQTKQIPIGGSKSSPKIAVKEAPTKPVASAPKSAAA